MTRRPLFQSLVATIPFGDSQTGAQRIGPFIGVGGATPDDPRALCED